MIMILMNVMIFISEALRAAPTCDTLNWYIDHPQFHHIIMITNMIYYLIIIFVLIVMCIIIFIVLFSLSTERYDFGCLIIIFVLIGIRIVIFSVINIRSVIFSVTPSCLIGLYHDNHHEHHQ